MHQKRTFINLRLFFSKKILCISPGMPPIMQLKIDYQLFSILLPDKKQAWWEE
jgi:hypothetical protein